jgi:GNAT superfamily N-acetyltransferase
LPVALEKAHADDIAAIARLRMAVAERLTRDFGQGHWSQGGSESGVIRDMAIPGLYIVRDGADVVATLRLAAKKPWAIDPTYFSNSKSPLYLTSMAVEPDRQRQGIGRACMVDALRIARDRSADAIRLDAYDALAGAGGFYEKCGFHEVGRVVYRTTPLIYYETLL